MPSLDIILRVLISPTSAFAEIRDNENKYFVQSIGILVFTSVFGMIISIPFLLIPFDQNYIQGVDDYGFPNTELDVILFIAIDIVTGVASAALLYFIGKKLGGNQNWKKVFSVIFHVYVHVIPFFVVISILLFLMLNSLSEIDPSFFQTSDGNDDKLFSVIAPVLGYVGMIAVVAIGFIVWIVIISVKAVKVLNEFSTAKAFGLLILVMTLTSIVTFPLGL